MDRRVPDRRLRRSRSGVVGALLLLALRPLLAASDTLDRISLSVDGSTLTNTSGGGGAAVGWLHNFDAQTVGEISVEHQFISNAQWTVGGADLSFTRGGADARYTLYGDAREGGGEVGSSAFGYSVVDCGGLLTYARTWTLQVEDRQIDVQTTHGNLPKLGIAYLWGQRVMASVSYADSVGGNLGTHLTAVRVEDISSSFKPLAGIAFGQAAPQIVDLQTGLVLPGRMLKEGYAGVSIPLTSWRGELMVLADYVDLAGSRRVMVTLNYVFQIGQARATQD
jgi:hypothetical protein